MTLSVTSSLWQQVPAPALDWRRYFMSMIASEGVRTLADMAVTQRGAGANMSVDIATGLALVQGDTDAYQGFYMAFNDASFNLTGFAAAHATNPRIDRVVLRVRDALHGEGANDEAFVILTGTATSGATLANLTGAAAVGNGQLLLANILIPATSTSVTTANIDTSVRRQLILTSVATELDYKQITAPVTGITVTTEATAVAVVTGNAVSYDGSRVKAEFFAPQMNSSSAAANMLFFVFLRDSTVIGQFWKTVGGTTTSTGDSITAAVFDTPSAGSHTYAVKVFGQASVTYQVGAGGGAAGQLAPAFLRVTRA